MRTIEECRDLQNQFNKYTETAEQHEYPLLMIVDFKLRSTMENIEAKGVNYLPEDEIESMFRVVRKIIGEDLNDR